MSQYAEKSSANSYISLILGMMLGGLLTALFTPRKGEDVRQFIKHRAQHLKKDATHTTNGLNDTLENRPALEDVDRTFK